MKQINFNGLYAITPDWQDTHHLLRAVTAALQGGASMIQYRNKVADQELRLIQASALQALCAQFDIPLIINDDLLLAKTVGAAGVHLGQSDENGAIARELLGKYAIIGRTCHDQLSLAQVAVQEGASYVAFGRFFPSQTKPLAPPAPISLIQAAKQSIPLPIVAIGGITYTNAHSLIKHGVDMVAVIEDLFSQPDIQARAQAFSQLFKESD